MHNESKEKPAIFLDRNIQDLSLPLKKLLLLDYMIYFNESSPNEDEINGLSSGSIPIKLSTKNTLDKGVIALFPKKNERGFGDFYKKRPKKPQNPISDEEFEDIEEGEEQEEGPGYEDYYEEEEEPEGEYDKMMREIDDEIQDQMTREMLNDRHEELALGKGFEEDEWEDVGGEVVDGESSESSEEEEFEVWDEDEGEKAGGKERSHARNKPNKKGNRMKKP